MAIQFNCPSCTQPIEVDDEVAGQSAACPYCGKVVTVPTASTYRPAVSARPIGEPGAPGGEIEVSPEGGALAPFDQPTRPPAYPPLPPYQAGGLHVGPSPDARARAARTLGNFALGCTAAVVALLVTYFVLLAPTLSRLVAASSQPSQKETMQILQSSPNAISAGGAVCGALVFSLVGLVLAGISLRQRAAGNWRGWTSIIVCGGTLSCVALNLLLTMAASVAL